ncbi:ABC transporter substrate-binding protein [Campylobacter sp. CX2-8023-23]|uniref:ABC transporter substrate-binding protein n=1 Tax=Campylobacter porcelli TaxID=1660073 RepID=UPI002E9B9849|nr:ABC transporter substrate-binding protein [Campylobacter sp. CX2-8023-23]
MNRRYALGFLAGFLALSATKSVANSKFKKGIKVGYLPICDHLIIIAKDIFSSDEFSITPIKFASWADLSEALRAGAIDAAFLLAPLGLMLKGSGVDIKAIMAAHKNGSSLVVNKSIKTIEDLKGKNIAIPSRFSSHYYILHKLLSKHNIEVNLVDMAPTEMPFALLTNRIDGYIVAEPFGQLGVQRGARNLILSKDITPDHICCLLNYSSELANSNIADQLTKAFKLAANFIEKNQKEAAIIGSKILAQDANIISKIVEENIVSYNDLMVKKEDLIALKEFLISQNLANDGLKNLDIDSYLVEQI